MHELGPKKLRAKRTNDLCKMLVTLPALLGAPRGPPGGPGLLLTGGRSYSVGWVWLPETDLVPKQVQNRAQNALTPPKLIAERARPGAPARTRKIAIFPVLAEGLMSY
jgi:hypothetical protein